jgi:hypothetical protein
MNSLKYSSKFRIMSEPTPPTREQLKAAFQAFRKRLTLTQLDEDSRLGRNPLTGGQRSSIVAIVPPNQFPQEVWEELVKQGKLKRAGGGTYELVPEDS